MDKNMLSFMFGNVDEEGKLENEDLDEELKNTLLSSGNVLSKFLQSSALIQSEGGGGGGVASGSISEGKIRPSSNAIDFTEETELLEYEEEEEKEEEKEEKVKENVNIKKDWVKETRDKDTTVIEKKREDYLNVYSKELLKKLHKDTKVKFTQLTFAPGQYDKPVVKTRASIRREMYVSNALNKLKYNLISVDEEQLFNSEVLLEDQNMSEYKSIVNTISSISSSSSNDQLASVKVEVDDEDEMAVQDVIEPIFHPINISNWEDEIIFTEPVEPLKSKISFEIIPDYDLLIGEWETAHTTIDDSNSVVEIPLNDPNLIIDIIYPNQIHLQLKQTNTNNLITFNNNNNNNTIKLQRANLSKSFIEHSLPALQLKQPLFRRYMSKADMRSFHRPPLKLQPNEIFHFQRVKQLKNRKKMYKGQTIADILQSTDDLTLKDNSQFVMFEYSEEYPPLLSNTGMGSLVVNYYRKKEDKDPFIPKLPIGQPHVLEQVDSSPFFMFGQVEPGETMQAIRNNLYIAPIWMHELPSNDFLLIKYTPKSSHAKSTCYLREIPRIFTVGQTFPLTLVHPPQSRKMKLFIRDRLKVLALRRIKKKGRHAKYPVHHIVNSFHRYHDQSIRKHLKDFAQVIRGPNNTQYLKVNENIPIPSEQELQKMCTPEMVCCFESLRVGQQRLADIGYGSQSLNVGDSSSVGSSIDNQMDDEIQLAPWNVTRNFLLAAQQKGMVQVYGPGDPTGRGEGFSMFRFSMKEMFIRAGASREEIEAYYQSQTKTGHRFSITDQQKMYQEELRRVWEKQKASLSSSEDVVNDAQIEQSDNNNIQSMDAEDEKEWREVLRIYGDDQQSSGATSPTQMQIDFDQQSIQSFSSKQQQQQQLKKALLIKRLINGHWQEEVVTDPRVIQPYMKQKRLMELAGGGKNAISLEDDEETIKKKIKGELRRLKRESGISKADLIKRAQQARNEEDGDRLGSSQRKCRSCGQLGHIMTNRICPNFATNYPEKAKQDAASNIKIENGKLVIPTVALQVVEEKIQKEKVKQEKQKGKLLSVDTPPATTTASTTVDESSSIVQTGVKREREESETEI